MPMDTEIARSFLDWSTEEVTKWLGTLSLSQDYSEQFKEHHITGETLIKLNPAALDELKITEGADRVKILQQITTMRADLIIDAPMRRVRSPSKSRRFSEAIPRSSYSLPNQRHQKPKLSTGALERTLSPVKRVHTPVSPRHTMYYGEGASLLTNSPDSLSPVSSGMSSPTKFRSRDGSPHEGMSFERRERELVNKLQATATLRSHNMHRLSRSLDGLFQDGEDIFSLAAKAELQENCNSRLVEILREENATLKRDLETYYQRVRKLQRLEQEVEHIREGQRMLEASTSRREKLEAALRSKLEKQVRNLRAEIIHLKAELHKAKKQDGKTDTKNGEATSPGRAREIRRRDTMIMRLIKQNQESAAVREQLEKDLHSTRIQLQERSGEKEEGAGGETMSDSQTERINSETERRMSRMYSQSIDKLKSVLTTMQSMSQKREKLEKHLREQLLAEIGRLKGSKVESRADGMKESKSDLLMRVATLEADLIKWEQKCLELVAEKQMVLEAAVLPRESRVEHLERTVSEQTITIQELHQQRASYVDQLTSTNKRLAELETKVSSLRLTVNEKDAVIQAMQHSFLDPDELNQEDHPHLSSPVLHHSPVAAKKITFPLNGAQVDVDGTVSLPGDVLSNGYPGYPPSPPMKRRGMPNGTYLGGRGHMTEGYTPMRRYSDKGVAVGQSGGRALSPVKRASITQPTYVTKDPPAYGNGGCSEYNAPNPHYGKLNYPPLPVSNSAPNSPSNRIGGRKPRISHPNMHFLQVPNSKSSPPPPSPRKFESGKSSTSAGELRRNLSKTPLSPKPPDRAVKSKTPPPNYKLVTSSSSSGSLPNRSTAAMPKSSFKQRHHSVDDVLRDESIVPLRIAPSATKDSMDLFNSLLGDNVPPQSQSEYKKAMQMGVAKQVGVAREKGVRQGHQHSKSSPSSERRNCYAYGN